MADISPILDSTKIALEREASTRFGAAVEDFSKSVIGPALGLPGPLPGGQVPFNRNDGSFYATSYAAALAGGTSYRPKQKFLFKVEFVFTPEAVEQFPQVLGGTQSQDFTFMVRSVDRPKIDFDYEEDVNMYNFRTKVLKRISHRELTITFMDDIGNRVLNFFRALMMIYSPITRRQLIREQASDMNARLAAPTSMVDGNGMTFNHEAGGGDINDLSHRGFVNTNVGSLISTIRVKQIYVDPGEQLGSSVKEIIFDFLNARLKSFDLDDLSHESSDVNLMTMQFDYDWMEIVEVGALKEMDSPHYKGVSTPGEGGVPIDMSTYGSSSLSNPGGGNGFANIITNQLGRAAQQITSSAISRGITAIAGKGQFASLLNSQASNILGGVVGAASRDISSRATGSISQGSAGLGSLFSGAPNVIQQGGPSSTADSRRSLGVNDSAVGGPTLIARVVSTEPAAVVVASVASTDDGFSTNSVAGA